MLKERFVTNPIWVTFIDIYSISFKGSIGFTVNWIPPTKCIETNCSWSETVIIEWGHLKRIYLSFKTDFLAGQTISENHIFDCTTFAWKS